MTATAVAAKLMGVERTVQNLVHSDRTACRSPARPEGTAAMTGVAAAVTAVTT